MDTKTGPPDKTVVVTKWTIKHREWNVLDMINLPVDFEEQMNDLLGDEYGSFRKSYEEPYYSALRRNKRKINEDDLSVILANDLKKARIDWESAGYYTDCLNIDKPGKSPFHEAGLYYIQEPSAMLPVTMLDVDDSGMKVLDLCAAPGGKTTQIADRMCGKGLLIANEIIGSRAKILSENIERMCVSNAIVISSDPRDLTDRFDCYFDRILVDAPCSGEGMFRKHPEAIEEWSRDNVRICADRQSWVMDCAAQMLKPGGRMVYSTCTFNRKEDEESVINFLNRHEDFILIGDCHRIFPHRDRGEGHFAAVFEKKNMGDGLAKKKYKTEKSARTEQVLSFFEFAQSSLTDAGKLHLLGSKEADKKIQGMFLVFGNELYLAPYDTPSLKGLKVMRPGLHLGTLLKNRFEPSHALALFLNKDDVRSCFELIEGRNLDEVYKYLHGESLSNVDGNGWTLALVKGYSLGWGKISGTVMKNHYPKGLRWN